MKKSELVKIIKEELQGYSPQIGKTKGLTPDTLNKILMKIASGDEYEPEGEVEERFKEALLQLEAERPGLWANINAKRKRGEKPSHGNSKAHKDAVAAGKKINAMSEDKAEETYKVISKEKTTGFDGESYDKYTVDMGEEEYTTPEGLTFTLKVEGSALVEPGEKLDLNPGSKHKLYHASIDVDYKGKNLENIPGWATNYKNVKAQFTKAKRWLDKNGSKLIKGGRYQHKST